MAAIVAGPGVIDAAFDVKPGRLGDEEDAAAARASVRGGGNSYAD
jgi:hypothetical protein